jgi:phosphoribosyl-AMP cyclohydrolase
VDEEVRVSREEVNRVITTLNFRHEEGTVIAVIQDAETGEVLMVGNMNEEAVRKTLETGYTHLWSLSRKTLWKKGETSGNYQLVKEVVVDCDGDAILVKVKPMGPACHTGNRTCFFKVALQRNSV